MSNDEGTAIDQRLDFAVAIAREAGQRTLTFFRGRELDLERKADGSPVTAADRDAERSLREAIQGRFSNDSILGEEFGESPGESGYTWILDPIDGTKSFVSGVPLYTTLVAVMREQRPVLGVIYAPAVDEMVYAASGEACWHTIGGSAPCEARISPVERLEDAIFATTSVRSFSSDRSRDARPFYDALQEKCRITRTWGDAFGYLLVATGRADLMVDPAMNLWDAAALQPIIEAAGGQFLDWQGQPSVHSGEAIATNATLWGQVSQVLAASLPPS